MRKCSLPYRQLRNANVKINDFYYRSLPYRQLRNMPFRINERDMRSLPYRQLRNADTTALPILSRSLPYRQLRKLIKKIMHCLLCSQIGRQPSRERVFGYV